MPRKGGAKSPEHLGKLIAGGMRAQDRKKKRIAAMASGNEYLDNGDFRPQRAHVDTTPAVWLPATLHIGDSEYVTDPVDECLLRAVRERVVYADSGCRREPPLREVVERVLAQTEKQARKRIYKESRPKKSVYPPPAKGLLKPFRVNKVKTTVKTRTAYREGKPLTQVVAEMFDGKESHA